MGAQVSDTGDSNRHGAKPGQGPAADAPAPPRLFISYSRSDQVTALQLISGLEQQGYAVWWDGLLEGGDNFLPTTQAALETAYAVVVLWSQTSVDSHWVRDEATVGRDRRRLVPLSIDGSLPPLGFRQFQVIDITGWNGTPAAPEFQRITRAITAVSGAVPAAGAMKLPSVTGAARPASVSRRNLLIGGAIVAGSGSFAGWRLLRPDVQEEAAHSVAVLPFRNLSGNKAEDYFAEGLAEELRTTLSLNHQLLVSGAASAGGFKGDNIDTRQIARSLGVSNLLLGSVRQRADTVRITARLVDGVTGFERWSQAFDRAIADVLAVQAEIATTVADALISTLAKDSGWRAERPGSTRNAEAFDAYVKGQALYKTSTSRATDETALASLDKAISLDGNYAAAHAARARTLAAIANQEPDMARGTSLRNAALASARKAIALAPDMPEGHSALGFLLMVQLDLAAAQPSYERALELGLGNASILSACAEYFGNMGDFAKAEAAITRAKRLDPLNPLVFRNAGSIAFAAHTYDAVRAPLETALLLNPKQPIVHRIFGDMAMMAGDFDGARRHFLAESSKLSRLRGLAIVEARLAGAAAGEARLAELVREFGDASLYQQAEVLAQWGRIGPALDILDRALALRDSGLVLAGFDPLLDPLRKQPRFLAVLAKIGLRNFQQSP